MGLQKVRRDLATKPPTTASNIINVLRMSSHLRQQKGVLIPQKDSIRSWFMKELEVFWRFEG